MTFQFGSLTDFVQMSGHGPYVWSAYGVGVVVLVWLIVRPLMERREVIRKLASGIRRQQQSTKE